MHTVAVVACQRVAPFELAIAAEVFGVDRSDLFDPWYRFKLCAASPPPIVTQLGFSIDTPYGLDDVATADTVVCVPTDLRTYPEPLLAALRTAHARGARVMSVCTGAFVLAAAGLLDGRRVTTHWMNADELRARHPAVEVDEDVLYVDDGDILTSAGTAAGIDLCLHVVRTDLGADVANAVARRMIVPPHRDGGQAQYIDHPVEVDAAGELFETTLAWAREHLDEPLTVAGLARRAAMSGRTFARRFRAATGTTPHRWLTHERVLLAQQLLETTDESVERIAQLVGLGTAANLRLHFQRIVQASPSHYRRTFRTSEVA